MTILQLNIFEDVDRMLLFEVAPELLNDPSTDLASIFWLRLIFEELFTSIIIMLKNEGLIL